MNELQKRLLDNFTVLTEVLEKNNIRYYLLGGTQLGATRHQGFIPWDDDIDIAIPRPDYMRLIENFDIYFKDHDYLTIGCKEKDPKYAYFYGKVYDKRTTLIEDYHTPIIGGVFIDIFPLDGIDYNKRKKIFNNHTWLVRLYRYKIGLYTDSELNFSKRLFRVISRFVSLRWVISKLNKIKRKYDVESSNYLAVYDSAYKIKEVLPKQLFTEMKKYRFETIYVNSFADDDFYLSQIFNDYMKLPPIEKRVSHHPIKLIDFNKSYLEIKEK